MQKSLVQLPKHLHLPGELLSWSLLYIANSERPVTRFKHPSISGARLEERRIAHQRWCKNILRQCPNSHLTKCDMKMGWSVDIPKGTLCRTRSAPLRSRQLVLCSPHMACRPNLIYCFSLVLCVYLIASRGNDAADLPETPIALKSLLLIRRPQGGHPPSGFPGIFPGRLYCPYSGLAKGRKMHALHAASAPRCCLTGPAPFFGASLHGDMAFFHRRTQACRLASYAQKLQNTLKRQSI